MTRVLDLFCGGGGSSWGARNAGAHIVGAVANIPSGIDDGVMAAHSVGERSLIAE